MTDDNERAADAENPTTAIATDGEPAPPPATCEERPPARRTRRRSRRLRYRVRALTAWLPRRLDERLRLLAVCSLVSLFVWISLHNDMPARLLGLETTAVRSPDPYVRRASAASAPRTVEAVGPGGAPERTGAAVRASVSAPANDAATAVPRSGPPPDGPRRPRSETSPRALSVIASMTVGIDADEALDAVLEKVVGFREPRVLTVVEGGSLWRTVLPVIDDAVVLDKLIDSLSASGMDVGSVRAGDELVADAAVATGYRLRIDTRDETYVSRIAGGKIVTAAYRRAAVIVNSSFALAATAAGVPAAVIEELTAAGARHALGLGRAARGKRYDVLYRVEREFDAARGEARAIALTENGAVVWTDAASTVPTSAQRPPPRQPVASN